MNSLPVFSPDDSRVALIEGGTNGAPGSTLILTIATGRAVTLRHANPCGPGSPTQFAFSADRRRVAEESFCGIAEVWDAATGRILRVVNQGAETSAVAFSPDGRRLVIGEITPILGAPNIVRVFDTCPACTDPRALLALAAPHATNQRTELEKTVLADS